MSSLRVSTFCCRKGSMADSLRRTVTGVGMWYSNNSPSSRPAAGEAMVESASCFSRRLNPRNCSRPLSPAEAASIAGAEAAGGGGGGATLSIFTAWDSVSTAPSYRSEPPELLAPAQPRGSCEHCRRRGCRWWWRWGNLIHIYCLGLRFHGPFIQIGTPGTARARSAPRKLRALPAPRLQVVVAVGQPYPYLLPGTPFPRPLHTDLNPRNCSRPLSPAEAASIAGAEAAGGGGGGATLSIFTAWDSVSTAPSYTTGADA